MELEQAEASAVGETAGVAPGRRVLPAWRPGDREFVALITFSHAVQHVYAASLPLVYPYVVAQFHVSYALLGLVLGASGVVGGLLQGAAGLMERASARRLLVGQNLLLAGSTVAAGAAPGFALFGAARCFGQVVASPQHPVGSAALSHRFPERRATVLSWHVIGGSLGTISVPLVASLVIAHWGWRASLFVFAVPMALGGLLLALRLREKVEGHAAAPTRATADVPLRAALLRRSTVLVLVSATLAAGGRGLGVLNAYVPSYLRSGLGLGTVMVGVIFTVLLLGSVVGPVVAGQVSDRLGRRKVVLAAYALGAAAIAVFGVAGSHVPLLLVSGLLVGIFAYAESPLLQSVFSDAVQGTAQRAAFGIFFAVAYGFGSIWATVIGKVIDAAGFHAAFLVMAGSFVAAGAALLFAGDIDAVHIVAGGAADD